MEYDREVTAKRLKDLRKRADISLKGLSEAIEKETDVRISTTQLQKYENIFIAPRDGGSHKVITDIMNVRNLVALADYYEVPYDYLLGYGHNREDSRMEPRSNQPKLLNF